MNPVVHVEIPVTDLGRAMRFYGAVFGDIVAIYGNRMAFFPFEDGQEGASVALVQGDVYVPTLNGAIVYFAVGDIDAVIAHVQAHECEFLFAETVLDQGRFVAEIRDTEGNRIAMQTI